MNTLRALALCLLLCLCTAPFSACAAGEESEEASIYTMDGRTLTVHEGVTALGADSPASWRWLNGEDLPPCRRIVLPSTLREVGSESFLFLALKELSIPEGVETFGDCAFVGCTVGTLHLPASFQTLSASCGDRTDFTAFSVDENNPFLTAKDGVLYTKDMRTLLMYPNMKADAHFDVPKGVRAIADIAFCGNRWLQSISLPLGLQAIGRSAFAACGRLASVSVPLTVRSVGDWAFSDCVSLSRVSLPPHAQTGEDVFDNCPLLKSAGFEGDNGVTVERRPVQEPGKHAFTDRARLMPAAPGAPIAVYSRPDTDSALMALIPADLYEMRPERTGWYAIEFFARDPLLSLMGIKGPRGQKIGYVKAEAVARTAPEALFSLCDARPDSPDALTFPEPYRTPLPAYGKPAAELNSTDTSFYGQEGAYANIEFVLDDDSYFSCFVPLADCALRRENTGDDRALGLMVRETPLYKSAGADGPVLALLPPGTQAERLSEENGFVHVRGDFEDGFVSADCFKLVGQQKED